MNQEDKNKLLMAFLCPGMIGAGVILALGMLALVFTVTLPILLKVIIATLSVGAGIGAIGAGCHLGSEHLHW